MSGRSCIQNRKIRALTSDEISQVRAAEVFFRERRPKEKMPETVAWIFAPAHEAISALKVKCRNINLVRGHILRDVALRKSVYWSWSDEEWIETICKYSLDRKAGEPKKKWSARSALLAIAAYTSDFRSFEKLGRFNARFLAERLVGRKTIDACLQEVELRRRAAGFSAGAMETEVATALQVALLMSRAATCMDISYEILDRIRNGSARSWGRGAAHLIRLLFDAPAERAPTTERAKARPDGLAGVPRAWAIAVEDWAGNASGSAVTILNYRNSLLRTGRWLQATHPEAGNPADWSREVAMAARGMVRGLKYGDFVAKYTGSRELIGQPQPPERKRWQFSALRRFFADLEKAGIRIRFPYKDIFRLPRNIATGAKHSPRVIDEEIWTKLISAAMELAYEDLPKFTSSIAYYPIEMVRAAALVWLFAGLRRSELHRLPLDCIFNARDLFPGIEEDSPLLVVPEIGKSRRYLKMIFPDAVEAIEKWKEVRPPHPKIPDPYDGKMEDFLFVHRGKLLSKRYIGESLIPSLCRKAGIDPVDSRGPIVPHRARSTMASELRGAGLSLEEVAIWLGHTAGESALHYVQAVIGEEKELEYVETEWNRLLAMLLGDGSLEGLDGNATEIA
ncbi:site-specific integrase [Mangrovicoccus sp. HB161399]|uniref:tyrosine-type recombinase/integrase n=1 Tax=Mangrovicoccus sp. HB161399 TaxID=2720392 RepID=UPI0015547DCE|nr:site-specific integrase [Mangrovicoccus sp. HB161399]